MRGHGGQAEMGRAAGARRIAVLAMVGALATLAGPARAADGLLGFLQSTFGGGDAAPAPASAPPAAGGSEPARPLTVRRAPRKTAHAGVGRVHLAHGPVRTGPISIYEDPTLRTGDAVMTKDGMKVFAGGRFSPDRPYVNADFIAVSSAKTVTPEMRKAVTELNKLPRG